MASLSAGNDEYVGNLIAEAIEKIGPDGVISIESSSSSETSVTVDEGMKVILHKLTWLSCIYLNLSVSNSIFSKTLGT